MQNPIQSNLKTPLEALSKRGFSYIRVKAMDKRPEGNWKNLEDRITADEVVARVARGSNYGIVPPDGYFILDFDSPEAYQRSVGQDASIAESLTFRTPRGFHVFFKGEGIEQGASHTFLGQGVDIRAGNRGYVVGFGSVREDGRYEYLSGAENGILEVSDSLRALLQKRATKPVSEIFGGQATPPVSSPQAAVGTSSELPEGERHLTVMERAHDAKTPWKTLESTDEKVKGDRNDTLSAVTFRLSSIYADAKQEKKDEIIARLMEHADRLGNGDQAQIQQNRNTVTSQWREGAKSPATRKVKPDNSARYRHVFSQFDSHEFDEAFANLGIHLRSNEGRKKVEFWIEGNGTWEVPGAYRFEIGNWFVPDNATAETMMYLLNHHFGKERGESVVGVTITKEKFWQWIRGIASRITVHPFLDWIKEAQIDPDSDLTLENWLDPWLENPNSELNRWAARAIMIGIVQNVYGYSQPCRVIPVLRGVKEIGKTTLVSHLIPEEFRYHFGQFHVKRKSEMVNSIIGKYLCEFGELDGLSDTKVSIFKEFIGNLVNTTRLPWEPHYLDYRNEAFIIGTSNPDRTVPNDDALRSRLVFMNMLKGPNPKYELAKHLAHLYALARLEILKGERIDVIPEHLQAEQMQASEESVIINETMQDSICSQDLRNLADLFPTQGCSGQTRD